MNTDILGGGVVLCCWAGIIYILSKYDVSLRGELKVSQKRAHPRANALLIMLNITWIVIVMFLLPHDNPRPPLL